MTKRRVVQPQLRQRFPAREPEVFDDVVAFGGREDGSLLGGQPRRADQREREQQQTAIFHGGNLPPNSPTVRRSPSLRSGQARQAAVNSISVISEGASRR